MAKGKKHTEKKKKMLRYGKLYIIACVTCLVLGLTSFGIAHNISRSVIKGGEYEIKIPSYDMIIKENETKLKEKNEIMEKTEANTSETVENTAVTEDKDAVKVISLTEDIIEKGISFTQPCDGVVYKKFSIDKPLKSETMGDFRTHNGVDIKISENRDVFTAADGVVENIYDDDFFGKTVIITHEENFKTQYSNLSENIFVKIGEEVKEGDIIGSVGKSAKGEFLDEYHLHFAMFLNGENINPQDYILIREE